MAGRENTAPDPFRSKTAGREYAVSVWFAVAGGNDGDEDDEVDREARPGL